MFWQEIDYQNLIALKQRLRKHKRLPKIKYNEKKRTEIRIRKHQLIIEWNRVK